jgi:hypothetical protein
VRSMILLLAQAAALFGDAGKVWLMQCPRAEDDLTSQSGECYRVVECRRLVSLCRCHMRPEVRGRDAQRQRHD